MLEWIEDEAASGRQAQIQIAPLLQNVVPNLLSLSGTCLALRVHRHLPLSERVWCRLSVFAGPRVRVREPVYEGAAGGDGGPVPAGDCPGTGGN